MTHNKLPIEEQIHPNERREQSINLWERAYMVTLRTNKAFAKRLKELESWDDCNGNKYEHQVKVEALKRLIA